MPAPQPAKPPAPPKERLFRITDIPNVMQQNLGWTMAAQLMRRWFRSPARTMSDQEKGGASDPRALGPAMLDETTVSMQWVLGFSRVKLAHDRLLANWLSAEGLTVLADRIRTQAPSVLPKGVTSWRFGDLAQPCKVLDKTCQVNRVQVGNLSDPLDDFYGAMGKASLKLAITGLVTPQKNGRNKISVNEIAVYLRDTYDFNDEWYSQPLGYWGYSGVQRGVQLRRDVEIDEKHVEAGTVPADRLYAVQNDDFQRDRDKYRRGGDFIIFSADTRRTRLAKPLTLEI